MKPLVFCLALVLAVSCTVTSWAAKPVIGEEAWVTPVGDEGDGFLAALEMTGTGDTSSASRSEAPSPQGEGLRAVEDAGPYSEAEINTITWIVDGEVGGITGSAIICYADGETHLTDGDMLRRIHARVVANQIRSGLFPGTALECARQCWSADYARTDRGSSARWESCREAVCEALGGDGMADVGIGHYGGGDSGMADVGIGHYGDGDSSAQAPQNDRVPENVFAATCEVWRVPGWRLWARVDWDTGWVRGTFYYYAYG